MRTTRRHRSNTHSKTRHSKQHHSKLEQLAMDPKARTFHALNHWYAHLFKNFGWMVLEKSRGNHIKIESYKDAANRFLQSLEFRLKNAHDYDRKEDLTIMLCNVKILKQFIDREF